MDRKIEILEELLAHLGKMQGMSLKPKKISEEEMHEDQGGGPKGEIVDHTTKLHPESVEKIEHSAVPKKPVHDENHRQRDLESPEHTSLDDSFGRPPDPYDDDEDLNALMKKFQR